MLYISVNNFSVMPGLFPVFLGWTSTRQRKKCLAQGYNTVIEPAILWPAVYHWAIMLLINNPFMAFKELTKFKIIAGHPIFKLNFFTKISFRNILNCQEVWIRGPSVSSQALYHWAIALPEMYNIKMTVDCVCIYWGPHGRLATTCTYFVCAKCSYPKKRPYLLVAWTQIWFDSKQFNILIYLVWIYCFTSQSTVMVKSGLSVHLATHFSWASLTKQLISTSLISE